MPIFTNRSLHNVAFLLLCISIISILLIEFLLNLTPPTSRDAVIHHLAIPKLWIVHGGFYETKWAPYSYYPMNVDLLYLIPMYFKKDFLANFIHMGFGIGTAFLVYAFLNHRINRFAGLLGGLIFLSTPMIIRLSTETYIDLGLTFFTTASILAFIRYRDSEFKDFKWLLISAVSMGLALGTKYNALIPWFFLSAAITYIYAKDTGQQWKAIKCGLIFFLISLLIFSPWLIKNTILTDNPLYPLFKGIFKITTHQTREGTFSIVHGQARMGIFEAREIYFGESFWETLTIPVRFFFQGQDNNPRFFDGVLNPILIILPPFAYMNKTFRRDKLLLTGFAVFVMLIAFFLDEIRVRYILPVIPVLTILAVMGLINLQSWTMTRNKILMQFLMVMLVLVFIMFMAYNFFYLKNYFQGISPVNYISGIESKDSFISRRDASYPAIKYINESTPADAKIRLILLAGRGYYLERLYEDDPSMGMNFIRGLVASSNNDESFQRYIHSLGYTHLLIRTDLFQKFLQDNLPEDKIRSFTQCMNRAFTVLYSHHGYAVYKIQ